MAHFRIATFNANSIRIRLDQLLFWITEQQADVVCVQETKVQDGDFPTLSVANAGLNVTFSGQKSHAGVATLSRTAPDQVQAGFDDGTEAARMLYTRIEGLHIINSYVPQGRDPEHAEFQHKLDWFANIRAWFVSRFTPDDPIIWLGDLNVATEDIDVYDPKGLRNHVDFHPDAQAALEEVRAWGFVDCFRLHHPGEPNQFTYWDYRARNPIERNVGWRIDHIWATAPLAEKCTSAWIDVNARRADRPSDHTFLVAEFDL
jgi:exodeoxyribonuclease III